jgi:gliding-associated putative ABC transporter substrate-binding component GldG
MKLTKETVLIRLLLFIGIFLMLNLLVYRAYFRLDFTADQRYTLSKVSKDILKNLDAPVTIKAFLSEELPPEEARTTREFTDLLQEFESAANGQLTFEAFDPSDEENALPPVQTPQGMQQQQYPGFLIGVRERDKVSQQIAYRGATVLYKGQEEMVPVLTAQMNMEYEMLKAIKKMVAGDKPKVGFLQGHGEAPKENLAQALQELSTSYDADTLSFDNPTRWSEFKTIVILAPRDSFPDSHLEQLDRFMQGGGRLFVGLKAADANLQNGQVTRITTGLEGWLLAKGIDVEPALLTDNTCSAISVQQRQGFFNMVRQVEFRYFPIVQNWSDHPITQGLGPAVLPFASPVNITNADSSLKTGILATTSDLSGKSPVPTFINIEAELDRNTWSFAYSNLPVAAYLDGKIGGGSDGKIIVIGNGEFPLNQGQQPVTPVDNLNFLINSIDWLTDDTGLIELRNQVPKVALIEKLTGEDDAGKRQAFKIIIFLLPIVIAIGFGFFRFRVRQARMKKWRSEKYS